MRNTILFLVFWSFACSVEGQWIDWSNQYPYPGHRVYSQAMHRTSDGNLLLCASINGGWTLGSGIPYEDYPIATYLVKVDPTGDTLWTARLDSIKPFGITHVVDLADGNTLIAGTAQSSATYCGIAFAWGPMAQLFALKVDQTGNVLWWNQYDQACTRILADAWETQNEEIHLLALNTQQPNIQIGYVPPAWFENYTLNGVGALLSVEDQPSGLYYSAATGVASTTSGRFVLASMLDTVGIDHLTLNLLRFNEYGDQTGQVLVSDTLYKNPARIITTLDDGLLLLANYDMSSSRLIHTDTSGTVIWDRIYPHKMVDIVALPDTTYLAVGTTGTWASTNMFELSVTLLSSTGDSLWTRTYGDSLNDMGSSIELTATGFAAYGTKDMYSGSVPPRLFLSWDSLELALAVRDAVPFVEQLSVVPNPAVDEVVLKWNKPMNGKTEITVLDPQGRLTLRQVHDHGSREAALNVSTLANGCYLVHIRTQHSEIAGRLMVAH